MQTLTLILRWVVVGWLFASAWELWRMQKAIGNIRLSRFAYKTFVIFIVFAALRFMASLGDAYFAFDVGVFSNIVNNSTYLCLYLFLRQTRKNVQNTSFDSSGNRRLSTLFDEIITEMKAVKKSLNRS